MTTPSPIPKKAPSVPDKAPKKAATTPTTIKPKEVLAKPPLEQKALAQILAMKPFQSAAVPGLFPNLSGEEVVLFVETKTEEKDYTALTLQATYYGVSLGKFTVSQINKGAIRWTP